LAQIGQALQNGNLAGAQQAFSTLLSSRSSQVSTTPSPSLAAGSTLGSVINTKA
jgi:hypothetical protein